MEITNHRSEAKQIVTAIAAYGGDENDINESENKRIGGFRVSLLRFDEGDLIEVHRKDSNNNNQNFGDFDDARWWFGVRMCGKQSGWFPASYVRPIGGRVGIAAAGLAATLKMTTAGLASSPPNKKPINTILSSSLLDNNSRHQDEQQRQQQQPKLINIRKNEHDRNSKKSCSGGGGDKPPVAPKPESKSKFDKDKEKKCGKQVKKDKRNKVTLPSLFVRSSSLSSLIDRKESKEKKGKKEKEEDISKAKKLSSSPSSFASSSPSTPYPTLSSASSSAYSSSSRPPSPSPSLSSESFKSKLETILRTGSLRRTAKKTTNIENDREEQSYHSHSKTSTLEKSKNYATTTTATKNTNPIMQFQKYEPKNRENEKKAARSEIEPQAATMIMVRAIAAYECTDDTNQLRLRMGDLFRVHQMTQSGWWQGERILSDDNNDNHDNRVPIIGWFPASYVELVSDYSTTTGVEFLRNKITTQITTTAAAAAAAEAMPISELVSNKSFDFEQQQQEYTFSDDSFESDDSEGGDDHDYHTRNGNHAADHGVRDCCIDSDYESSSYTRWIDAINSGGSGSQSGESSSTTTSVGYAARSPLRYVHSTVAILSLLKIEAVHLYAHKYPLKIYLKVATGRDWNDAHRTRITSTATIDAFDDDDNGDDDEGVMKSKNEANRNHNHNDIVHRRRRTEWITNFRMNIYDDTERLLIAIFDESSDRCVAEVATPLPLADLIAQSKHLANFTKGVELTIRSDRLMQFGLKRTEKRMTTNVNLASKPPMKPCLLIKFDMIDLR